MVLLRVADTVLPVLYNNSCKVFFMRWTQQRQNTTRMWADAQRDGLLAKYRWRPL